MMINSVAIVGAGTMGNGIAHTFALHQFRVTLTDLNETALNRALQTIARNAE
ncbi:MAG: 3-hydroxybutyryl-CoA dehydrogenase, partial [Chitinophagaceae bacterium]|nr:3-hydroxybutyryl-CoA dehydrogenase [Chitinophagaceae bacterium]